MLYEEFTTQPVTGFGLFWRVWKPDTTPSSVICLVHGLGEHTGRYQHVAEAFINAGYAVIAFDLPGHGRSEGKRGYTKSYSMILDDVDTLLIEGQKRFPGIPLFLYGHSLGGNIVMNYMRLRSPKLAGVIATSPLIATGTPPPGWKVLFAKILSNLVPDFIMNNGLDAGDLSRDPNVGKIYKDDPLVHPMISAQLAWDLLDGGNKLAELPFSVSSPLLIMQGEADKIVDPTATRKFAEKLKCDVTFKMWPEDYHELHNELNKNEVIQAMIDWIRKHSD